MYTISSNNRRYKEIKPKQNKGRAYEQAIHHK